MTTTVAVHAFLVAVQARELDGRFVGLAARIAEEHIVHTCQPAQQIGELLLLRDPVQIGCMDQARRLLRDGAHEAWVAVSQPIDGDADSPSR
jgi:hypothetical protein